MKIKLLAGLAAVALLCAQAAAAAAEIKVPEGTEFPMRLEEAISSQTAQTGDRFAITLDDDVMLADGTLLKAGYRGVGEIVDAQAKGMLGKTGKLNIRLLYVKVGDQRIRLRANKGAKGDNRTGAQVVTVLLLWPVAPFIKGKNVTIKKGAMLTAYSDQDTVLASAPAPPTSVD